MALKSEKLERQIPDFSQKPGISSPSVSAVWISLLLHGMVLLIPIPGLTPSPSDAPPDPEDTITLTELLAPPVLPLTSSSPVPVPSLAPPVPDRSVEPPPASQQAIAPPLAQSSPSTSPTPSDAPSPTPAPVESPVPSPEPETTPLPATPTPPPEENADEVQPFLSQLATTAGVPAHEPAPELFADPSLYFERTEPAPTLHPDILRAVWLEGKTPQQVYISVLVSQQNSSFQTIQKPDYGGGTVYEITQGDHIWYLNLVPTANGTGTIIVVWNRDPSRPAPLLPLS